MSGADKEKILVTEDDPLNKILARDVLTLHGYEVLEAATGQEAILLARRERPHLILMDIGLPDMSGIDTLRLIRADPSLVDIPVVAVTAYAMQGDEENLLQAGFDGYLSKPIDIGRFPEEVARYIQKPRIPPLAGPGGGG